MLYRLLVNRLSLSRLGSCMWLRFAVILQDHNDEFNTCGAVDHSRKRAGDADSSDTKRQKLEALEEAYWDDLMEDGPVSIVDLPRFSLMLAPAPADSWGPVWISSKCDMVLDTDDVLFSFGAGRRRDWC
jgi:hypothetical protein